MLEDYYIQTCTLIQSIRNEFGDFVYDDGQETPCRFREINTVKRESNAQVPDSDALLWIPAGTTIDLETVVLFDSIYYQVEKVTKARNFDTDEVQFIKCELQRIGIS